MSTTPKAGKPAPHEASRGFGIVDKFRAPAAPAKAPAKAKPAAKGKK